MGKFKEWASSNAQLTNMDAVLMSLNTFSWIIMYKSRT